MLGRIRVICLVLAALFIFPPAALTRAYTPIMAEFYVSPYGDDKNAGTATSPFKTLERAREAVLTKNQNMTGDIFVYLRDGVYNLEDTFALNEEDGGTNGFYVRYSAYKNEKPVISGGVPVTGWQKSAEYEGLWETFIGEVPHISELYVNRRQARRAESEQPVRVIEPYDDPFTEYPIDGVKVSKDDVDSSYRNQRDIQVHMPRAWISFVCPVVEIVDDPENSEQSIIRLENPMASSKQESYHGIDNTNPGIWLKHAFEELDIPGEYYYDRPTGKLLYMPREDEDMNTAQVYRPVLEKIITIKGVSNNNKAKNIIFEGLEITHITWNRGMEEGFNVGQENELYLTPRYNDSVYNHEKYMIGAAIDILSSDGVIFRNNVIRGTHGAGIALHGGAYNTKIEGNVFEDIGDSAVTVGCNAVPYENKIHDGYNLAVHKKVTSSNGPITVTNRYLRDYTAPSATDPSKLNGWSSKSVAENPWLQIDLEGEYRIHRIEIDSRYGADVDNQLTRRNFEILGSNDPEFKTYAVLAVQGSEPFEHEATAVYYVNNDKEFRYVRLRKTVREYMYLNQIRIINEDMDYCQDIQYARHTKISNNYITRAGNVNWGGPGIDSYFTEDIEISNNEICDLPYSGIATGWGWSNYIDMYSSRDIRVLNNEVYRFMQTMWDGGGVYNLGPQYNSVIAGNYFYDAPHYQGGVYLDQASRFFTVSDNVFEDTASAILVGTTNQRENIVKNNYTSSEGHEFVFRDDTVSYAEQPILFVPGDYPLEAIEIMENAGIRDEYKHIKEKSTPRLFEVSAIKQHENAIYTSRMVIGDDVFNKWYLSGQVKTVREWMKMAEVGTEIGQYPQEEFDSMKAFLEICEVEYRKKPIDRYKIMELYDELRERIKKFAGSRIEATFSQTLSEAKRVLVETSIGEQIGNITKRNYDEFTARIEKSQMIFNEKGENVDRLEKLKLSKAIEGFLDKMVSLDIKSFGIAGQIGDSILDSETNSITVVVPHNMDTRRISPSVGVSNLVNVTPNINGQYNFSVPFNYTLATRDGQSSKTWTVNVEKKTPKNSAEELLLDELSEDVEGWELIGTSHRVYKNEAYGDATLRFGFSIASKLPSDYPSITFRNQAHDKSYTDQGNSTYIIVFSDDKIEFHRFNGGVRTQFYGPVGTVDKIYGEAITKHSFKYGVVNDVAIDVRNVEGGVRIKLIINGEQVFDVLDNLPGVITEAGYVGVMESGAKIDFSKAKRDE